MIDECIKTAHQAAHSFYVKNPTYEWEEIISKSNLIMIEAIKTHDPLKGRSLKSWVAFMTHRELNRTLRNYVPVMCEYNDELTKSYSNNPERILIFKETLKSLSTASREAIDIVLCELVVDKSEIKKRLRDRGFAYNKIQKAFNELRRFANSLT